MLFWIVAGAGLVLLLVSLLLDDLLESFDFGSEWISGTAIGGFLAAFGFVGGLVLTATGSVPAATGGGFVGGLVAGGLAGAVTRALSGKSGGAEFTANDYVGQRGVVVTAIGAGSAGEVSLNVGGHPVKVNARCDQPVPHGAPVVVTDAYSATSVHVSPVNSSETPDTSDPNKKEPRA